MGSILLRVLRVLCGESFLRRGATPMLDLRQILHNKMIFLAVQPGFLDSCERNRAL